jgi:hypothetical protein
MTKTLPTQKVLLPGQLPNGETILSIIMKRSYTFEHNQICERAAEDVPIHTADIPYGDPMCTTIKYEADFVTHKLVTDVVLNGYAYAKKNATHTICSLQVGETRKEIKVFGNREAYISNNNISFSEPEIFEKIELRYENAYGGIDIYSDKDTSYPYPRNHMGKGFIVNPSKKIKVSLPNIETPTLLLTPENLIVGKMTNWERQPKPAGFGWYNKGWQPRCNFAGVLPAHKEFEDELFKLYLQNMPESEHKLMKSTRLPIMDFKFFSGASEGLSFPYILGQEIIKTTNMTPSGLCYFKLPNEKPSVSLTINKIHYEPKPELYTVMIRMEERQVDLTWCAYIKCPDSEWFTSIKNVELKII